MAMSGTIVVTGASGYIGSALVPRLHADGYSTRPVSRANAQHDLDRSREGIAADLRKPEAWLDVLNGATGVIHLSSRTDLHAAEMDEVVDDDLNVAPVRALVNALERCGGHRLPVVFASTVTIFGDTPVLPCDETAPDHPLSVYDRHKLKCETLLKEATEKGIVAACSLRLANVYGLANKAADTASTNSNRGILNGMMARAVRGDALTVYGAGNYVRDFVHLNDVVGAFTAALANARVRDGTAYVIATGKGHSLLDAFSFIACEAKSLAGHDVDIRHVPEPADLHQSERRNFIGNSGLFTSRTGWKPEIDMETGVRRSLKSFVTARLAASNG